MGSSRVDSAATISLWNGIGFFRTGPGILPEEIRLGPGRHRASRSKYVERVDQSAIDRPPNLGGRLGGRGGNRGRDFRFWQARKSASLSLLRPGSDSFNVFIPLPGLWLLPSLAFTKPRRAGRAHPPHPPADEVPPCVVLLLCRRLAKNEGASGTIVRSKEGYVPPRLATLTFLAGSYSAPFLFCSISDRKMGSPHAPDHSVSARTTPPRPAPPAPPPPTPTDSMHPAAHPRAPSYSPERDPSPSIQTSRSTSSLHPGDASYLPPEADPDSGVHKPIPEHPPRTRFPGGSRPRPCTTGADHYARSPWPLRRGQGEAGRIPGWRWCACRVVSESDSKGKQLGTGVGAQGQADASPVTADSMGLQAMDLL
ncbi:hypothetical protein A0H81_09308 [Grifola frondosa]|uniref:Uncharacterized protein n=1 Tax=Grifola frondosa TaxID=5627 RepID=A0A1C7M1W3_GRIFR|nr:hypothetical protein A0H81_09308 [Grifola frondosa]